MAELKKAIQNLEVIKAQGPDSIGNRALKHLVRGLAHPLVIMNKIIYICEKQSDGMTENTKRVIVQ